MPLISNSGEGGTGMSLPRQRLNQKKPGGVSHENKIFQALQCPSLEHEILHLIFQIVQAINLFPTSLLHFPYKTSFLHTLQRTSP